MVGRWGGGVAGWRGVRVAAWLDSGFAGREGGAAGLAGGAAGWRDGLGGQGRALNIIRNRMLNKEETHVIRKEHL